MRSSRVLLVEVIWSMGQLHTCDSEVVVVLLVAENFSFGKQIHTLNSSLDGSKPYCGLDVCSHHFLMETQLDNLQDKTLGVFYHRFRDKDALSHFLTAQSANKSEDLYVNHSVLTSR